MFALRRLLMPFALGIVSLAAAIPSRAAEHRFPLESLRLAACRVNEGRVVLGEWFDQGDLPTLAMEAEDALDLVADPRAGMEDAQCSGGRCLVKVDGARFPVNVRRAGRYRRWVRGFFPQGGGWVHSESLDFGEPQWHTDCDGSTAGRWVWVAGPVVDLPAGVHLLWLHNWHGGARLDKVVLAPEGAPAPEGVGPSPVKRTPATAGWVLTPALSIPGLSAAPRVEWPAEPAGARVVLSLSVDGGASFRSAGPAPSAQARAEAAAGGPRPAAPPAPAAMPVAPAAMPAAPAAMPAAPAAMPAAPAAMPAAPAVVVRADLNAFPDGRSVAVASPRVSYKVAPGALVTIEDERVRATFLRATGGLVGLFNKATKTECLSDSRGGVPFVLRHLPAGAGKPQPVPPEQIRLVALKALPAGLDATYRFAGNGMARLEVRLMRGEMAFRLAVANKSPLDIVEVVCPSVEGVRLGARSEDDRLITPNWQGGVETMDPVRSNGGSVPYPCGGGMAWLDLYEKEPAHGLTLSLLDLGSPLGCRIGADPDAASGTLTFGLTRYLRIRPGKDGRAGGRLFVHAGDWHRAADAYRSWFRQWTPARPTPPEWVREADGWYGLVTSASSSRIPFRRIPDYLKQMREMGTNYIQVWGQMTGGNNCDSLPYPNPVLGTLDEFKAAIREVQRWGGHITFYVSSQFWKVEYGDAPLLGDTPRSLLPATCPTWDWTEWRNYAIRSYSGEFSGDTKLSDADQVRYGTPWQRTVPCPYTDAWANRHLRYWCVSQYGAGYGANGIYLDETAAASERLCFAGNHGHAHHGIWGESLSQSVERMVKDGRRRDPNWMFAMEGCSDLIGRFADVNLISPASARKAGLWGANRRFAPEVFHYTFPEYILYDGVANGVYGGISQEDTFLNVHLHGNRYDAFSAQPAAAFIALRQRTKQFLYRARFLDNVGITTGDPAVQAKLNLLVDAENHVRIVNLANPERKPGVPVRVETGGKPPVSGYYFDLEGNEGPVAVTVKGGQAIFTAPASKASTVLLPIRCEPLVRFPVIEAVAGDTGELPVTLTNPLPRSVAVALTNPLPRVIRPHKVFGVALGLWAPRPSGTHSVLVPALSSVTLRLAVAVPAGEPRGCKTGNCRFGSSGERPVEILVRSPFEVAGLPRGDAACLVVRNRSGAAREGALTLSGALWPQGVRRPFSLPARGAQEIPVPLPEGTRLTEPVEVAVTLTSAGQSDRETVWLSPLVANAGFERAEESGRPASWGYQHGEQAATDAVGPAEGKTCLRLAGKAGAFLEAHQELPLEGGRTYEARCKMRRTPGAGSRIGPCMVLFLKAGGERYRFLEKVTDAPDDQWNEYRVSFAYAEDVRAASLYLYNVSSEATVWFDDVRLSE